MTIAAKRRFVLPLAIISALVFVTNASAASTETYTVQTKYGMPSPTGGEQTWLDTGVTLLGGTVAVTGSGEAVNCDPSLPCKNPVPFGPDGDGRGFCAADGYVCTAPNVSAYALLAAIGDGPPISIGSGPVTLTGQGRIYLAYNDGKYDDNCIDNPRACGALDAIGEPLFDVNVGAQTFYETRTGRAVTQVTLQLYDDASTNVSSADKTVRALQIVHTTGEEGEILSPGQPNPNHIFAYSGSTYRFHVDYTDLTRGTWRLSFAVDDVTTTWYYIMFTV